MFQRRQITLRKLFAVVTACAVLFGWLCWNRYVAQSRANLLRWCDTNKVPYLADGDPVGRTTFDAGKPPLVREWFGDRNVHFFVVTGALAESREKQRELESWFPEAFLQN